MRIGMFAAALAALALPGFVSAHDSQGGARVITVETQGAGVPHRQMTLALDKAAIVQLDTDARDVLVSDPGIVDAVVRTPRRIFLLAKKVGQANAFFFDAHGHQLFSLDINVERDVRPLSAMLAANMPDAKIRVSALNDNIVLAGTVKSEQESARAQDLAARFVDDPKKVVNMLTIDKSEQVMLKVRVAEVSRQIAKQFGIDLSSAAVAAGVPIVASTANPFGLTGTALSDLSGAQIGKVCAPTSAGTCTGGPRSGWPWWRPPRPTASRCSKTVSGWSRPARTSSCCPRGSGS